MKVLYFYGKQHLCDPDHCNMYSFCLNYVFLLLNLRPEMFLWALFVLSAYLASSVHFLHPRLQVDVINGQVER